MAKVLFVEDDSDLAGRVEKWLVHEQHTVELVFDGKEAADRMRLYKYDVVVLDWGLPSMSGLEICKEYRAAGGTTPVLMLTGKDQIADKEEGLDSGADDYLTKPFHLKELSARLRALLRRPQATVATILKLGSIELDPKNHRVTNNGEVLDLLPKEFALLEFFMKYPNEVFSPEALMDRVWSSESDSSPNTVYTYIKTLRKKISPDAPVSIIKTVHGKGYKVEVS
jgi:DNA-binding response OmpR family regulator